MKNVFKILVPIVPLACAVLIMLFIKSSSEARAEPKGKGSGFIIDKVKELQALVGCEKIDAKIGPETTRLVNAAVETEERELFNQYAARYMTASGAPKDE